MRQGRFVNLSSDVLLRIISILEDDFASIVAIAGVCKQWRECFKHFQALDVSKVPSFCKFHKRSCIRSCDCIPYLIRNMLPHTRELKKLNIVHANPGLWELVSSKRFDELRELHLELAFPKETDFSTLSACSSLEILKLKNLSAFSDAVFPALPRLKRLRECRFLYLGETSNDVMTNFLRDSDKLHTLELCGIEVLDGLHIHHDELRSLKLEVATDTFTSVSSPQLKELFIGGIFFCKLEQGTSSLESITLDHAYPLDHDGVLSGLRRLTINGSVKYLSDIYLKMVMERKVLLTHLELTPRDFPYFSLPVLLSAQDSLESLKMNMNVLMVADRDNEPRVRCCTIKHFILVMVNNFETVSLDREQEQTVLKNVKYILSCCPSSTRFDLGFAHYKDKQLSPAFMYGIDRLYRDKIFESRYEVISVN